MVKSFLPLRKSREEDPRSWWKSQIKSFLYHSKALKSPTVDLSKITLSTNEIHSHGKNKDNFRQFLPHPVQVSFLQFGRKTSTKSTTKKSTSHCSQNFHVKVRRFFFSQNLSVEQRTSDRDDFWKFTGGNFVIREHQIFSPWNFSTPPKKLPPERCKMSGKKPKRWVCAPKIFPVLSPPSPPTLHWYTEVKCILPHWIINDNIILHAELYFPTTCGKKCIGIELC